MLWNLGYSCNQCFTTCRSFANNLIATYYDYMLSKVEIINDPTNNLIDIFDNLNLHKMLNGMTPVLLNYGNGITITRKIDIRYDKNYNALGGRVIIDLDRLGTREVFCLRWDLYKKENKEVLKNTLIMLGQTSAEIIEMDNSEFLNIKNETPIFKCIFFKNNISETSSLYHCDKILYNIHKLDNINNKNQDLINVIYQAKTGKKLTQEQANNLSITISTDGYGLTVVESDGTETEIGNGLQKDVITKSLNNWSDIKNEIEFWEDRFQKYTGMPSEKLSNQRENLGETLSRTARVNASDKQYYKFITKFLNEYQEYFNVKIEYQFDTMISDTLKLNANQQKIKKITDENTLTELDVDTNE